MTGTAYVAFILSFAVLGAMLGLAGHFWRAHATMFPEDLGLGETANILTRNNYLWEKYVMGAEWDDAGYWASGSVRNLLLYMAWGFMLPVLLGAAFWGERAAIVTAICAGLSDLGFTSLLCS